MLRSVVSILAHVTLFVILVSTAAVVQVSRWARRVLGLRCATSPPGSIRVLLTGTFYNRNWYRSHVRPLSAAAAISTVYVVTERPLPAMDKVRYVCPPRWCALLLGRSLSRAICVLTATARYRPDVVMGYHIMPNALVCLIAASLFGGRSVYQMTGGPIQIIGGGVGSENVLLCRLGRSSRVLERLLFHVVRQFDLVVVRGGEAMRFLKEHRLARQAVVIPGSVDTERFRPNGQSKRYDLVMVARLIWVKQPQLFVDLVARIKATYPGVRAALVGDGPMADALRSQVSLLGLEDNIELLGRSDRVDELLAASRVFVLTSSTEGLSIAMMEAMAAGLPLLAPAVGELPELLVEGETGMFIEPTDVDATARRANRLLQDESCLSRMSSTARDRAVAYCSVPAVAERWNACLAPAPSRRETPKIAAAAKTDVCEAVLK